MVSLPPRLGSRLHYQGKTIKQFRTLDSVQKKPPKLLSKCPNSTLSRMDQLELQDLDAGLTPILTQLAAGYENNKIIQETVQWYQ